MSNERVMNRWLVVVGAILIQFCLGAIYAWSAFTADITKPVKDGGLYGFTATRGRVGVLGRIGSFAVVMVLAGRLQARIGPRPIAVAGGIVLGVGYILGGFFGQTFAGQLICIGLIGGAGIGLAYVVPIAVGVKWFPDKKGMVTGLAVAGFGFGATLWVKLAGSWFGGLLNTTAVFGLPGVQSVFVIYGIVFLVCVLLGSIVMVNPPAGYKPAGWEPPAPSATGKATGAIDLTSGEMLATPQFYMLWLMFVGSALAGLMVIGCIGLFGKDALLASGAVAGEDAAKAVAGHGHGLVGHPQRLGPDRLGHDLRHDRPEDVAVPDVPVAGHHDARLLQGRRLLLGIDRRRLRHRLQLRRQLRPVPGGHRRLLRQQERRHQLRLGLPGLRRGGHRRSAGGRPFQGRGQRWPASPPGSRRS